MLHFADCNLTPSMALNIQPRGSQAMVASYSLYIAPATRIELGNFGTCNLKFQLNNCS